MTKRKRAGRGRTKNKETPQGRRLREMLEAAIADRVAYERKKAEADKVAYRVLAERLEDGLRAPAEATQDGTTEAFYFT